MSNFKGEKIVRGNSTEMRGEITQYYFYRSV